MLNIPNRKRVPMIRISLPWVVDVVRAVDGLERIRTTVTNGDAWPTAYSAKNQLEMLFSQSLYGSSLRSSENSATTLHGTLERFLEAKMDEKVDGFDEWQIANQKDQFLTVFMAELATLPAYYVLAKPPYDINTLLNNGEALMPASLAVKVPEAVFDAKEAGKALAFELGTACGFHIFRVLESVVRRYHSEVSGGSAEPKQRNLGVYIRALISANADKKIIAALHQLKDLHRNPLVHPQVAIPVEEAVTIAGMVRSVVSAMLNELPDAPTTTLTGTP